jgi:hypothetical protein
MLQFMRPACQYNGLAVAQRLALHAAQPQQCHQAYFPQQASSYEMYSYAILAEQPQL